MYTGQTPSFHQNKEGDFLQVEVEDQVSHLREKVFDMSCNAWRSFLIVSYVYGGFKRAIMLCDRCRRRSDLAVLGDAGQSNDVQNSRCMKGRVVISIQQPVVSLECSVVAAINIYRR